MEYKQFSSLNSNQLLFEYFVVFILIFYAGKANEFVRSITSWSNPIGLMLPIITVGALGLITRVQFSWKFWLLILGFTFYFIVSTLRFGELHPRFYGINIIQFTIAYIVLSGLGVRFFSIYEDILYYLCIIALIFWIFLNLIPTPFIEFLRNFEFSTQGEVKGNVDFNVIIYTIPNYEATINNYLIIGGIKLFKNAGFAWESGVFASYVSIAIFFNLIRNKFKLEHNKHIWIFMAAIASTFSTTGYSLFVLLVLFYIYNQNLIKVIWLVPITIIITAFLFSLPFMAEKISRTIDYNTENLVYNSAKYNTKYSPQRFQSLQIDFIDFLNHPIIGYGGHQDARWTKQMGADIATASGFGKVMAEYGIVGILVFFISLYYSSKQILKLFNVKGTIFPMLLIVMISISYNIIFTSLLMCFWLLYLSDFLKNEAIRRFIIYNILKSYSIRNFEFK